MKHLGHSGWFGLFLSYQYGWRYSHPLRFIRGLPVAGSMSFFFISTTATSTTHPERNTPVATTCSHPESLCHMLRSPMLAAMSTGRTSQALTLPLTSFHCRTQKLIMAHTSGYPCANDSH